MEKYEPIQVKNILKNLRENKDENIEVAIDLNFNCNNKFTYTPISTINRILDSYRSNATILLKQTSNDDYIFSDVKTLAELGTLSFFDDLVLLLDNYTYAQDPNITFKDILIKLIDSVYLDELNAYCTKKVPNYHYHQILKKRKDLRFKKDLITAIQNSNFNEKQSELIYLQSLVGLSSDDLLGILNKAQMTTNFLKKVLEN